MSGTERTCIPWRANKCLFGSICHLNHDGPGGCTPSAPGPEVGQIYHEYGMSQLICKNWLVSNRCNHEAAGHQCRMLHLSQDDFIRNNGAAAIQAAINAGATRVGAGGPNNNQQQRPRQMGGYQQMPYQQQQQQQQGAAAAATVSSAASAAAFAAARNNSNALAAAAQMKTQQQQQQVVSTASNTVCPHWTTPGGCKHGALCLLKHPAELGGHFSADAPSPAAISAFDPAFMCRSYLQTGWCAQEQKTGKKCATSHFTVKDLEMLARFPSMSMSDRIDEVLSRYMHFGSSLRDLVCDNHTHGLMRAMIRNEVRSFKPRSRRARQLLRQQRQQEEHRQALLWQQPTTTGQLAAVTKYQAQELIITPLLQQQQQQQQQQQSVDGSAVIAMADGEDASGGSADKSVGSSLPPPPPPAATEGDTSAAVDGEDAQQPQHLQQAGGPTAVDSASKRDVDAAVGESDDGEDGAAPRLGHEAATNAGGTAEPAQPDEVGNNNSGANLEEGAAVVATVVAAADDDDGDDDDSDPLGIDKLSNITEFWLALIGDDTGATVELARAAAARSGAHRPRAADGSIDAAAAAATATAAAVVTIDKRVEDTIVAELDRLLRNEMGSFFLLELLNVSPTLHGGVPRPILRAAFRLLSQRTPVAHSVARRAAFFGNYPGKAARYVIEYVYHDFLGAAVASLAPVLMNTADGMQLVSHVIRHAARSKRDGSGGNNPVAAAREYLVGSVLGAAPFLLEHASGNQLVADLIRMHATSSSSSGDAAAATTSPGGSGLGGAAAPPAAAPSAAAASDPSAHNFVLRGLWTLIEANVTGSAGTWIDLTLHRFAGGPLLTIAECAPPDVLSAIVAAFAKQPDEQRARIVQDNRALCFAEALFANRGLARDDCETLVTALRAPVKTIPPNASRTTLFVERMQAAMKRLRIMPGARRHREEGAAPSTDSGIGGTDGSGAAAADDAQQQQQQQAGEAKPTQKLYHVSDDYHGDVDGDIFEAYSIESYTGFEPEAASAGMFTPNTGSLMAAPSSSTAPQRVGQMPMAQQGAGRFGNANAPLLSAPPAKHQPSLLPAIATPVPVSAHIMMQQQQQQQRPLNNTTVSSSGAGSNYFQQQQQQQPMPMPMPIVAPKLVEQPPAPIVKQPSVSAACIQQPPPFLVRAGTKVAIPATVRPTMWPPPFIVTLQQQQQQQQPQQNINDNSGST